MKMKMDKKKGAIIEDAAEHLSFMLKFRGNRMTHDMKTQLRGE
jgi:hypothetical protein